MIILEGVTKAAGGGEGKRTILQSVQARLPSDRRIAILGPRSDDKKVFINLLAGVMLPSAGRIIRKARLSFPAGHLGGLDRALSIRLNVAHVARIYGADIQAVVDFVAQVLKLGDDFNKPYSTLSAAMKQYLSDILTFTIPFDAYLLNDEVVCSGNKRYNPEARALFEARAKTSGMFIASQDPAFVHEFCDMGLVLKDGQLRLFENLDQAFAFSEQRTAAIPIAKPAAAIPAGRRLAAVPVGGNTREERRAARKKKRKRLARKRSRE
jgi:capsular polysaccharide transport system ATP-binding protein